MSDPNRVGLVFAALLGGIHLLWVALVGLGVGQALYDFVLWAHMIHVALKVGPFDAVASITLVGMTALLGYVGGYIGSFVSNRLH